VLLRAIGGEEGVQNSLGQEDGDDGRDACMKLPEDKTKPTGTLRATGSIDPNTLQHGSCPYAV
jgi:hypothetical protein